MLLRIFLAMVFAVAAWLRFRLPQLPLATHDTWGYLYPALAGLAGEGMPETNARGIAYPLFLRLVLGATSSFPAVAVVQHVLGLASGLLWWLCWRLWSGWLPEKFRSTARWCGAVGLALYLCNANTIFYESTLRPEAIFPFFALLGLTGTWLFVCARWVQPHSSAAGWGSVSVFCTLICLSLKPSWGLAALIPVLLVLASFIGNFPLFWRGMTAAGCALAAGIWVFAVPAAAHWSANDASRLFLPETLFVQHAPSIAEALAARDARGELAPEERMFLANLQARLGESRTTHLQTFRNLGHNPDYLLYESDALAVVPAGDNLRDKVEFLWQGYFSAWTEQPLMMLSKIFSQTAQGFGMGHKSLCAPEMVWRARVQTSADVLRLNQDAAPVSAEQVGYRSFAAATEEMLASAPEKVRVGPLLLAAIMQSVGTVFVAAGMLAWPLLCCGALRSSGPLLPAVITFGIFWASALGSVLTVAVVSSFDITRYAALQSFLHAFVFSGALVFVCAAAEHWLTRRRSTAEFRPEKV